MFSLILYSNIAKGLDCFTLNDIYMLRNNTLFIGLLFSFLLGGTHLLAQGTSTTKLPLYFYGQWGVGQGNRIYDTFPDWGLSCGLGWKTKSPFYVGLGFSRLGAFDYSVASFRQLNGLGIQGGYFGKHFIFQAEVGRMLSYEEGYSDQGYGYRFLQDRDKGMYLRLSPMIRIGPFMAIHLSWYESQKVDGYLRRTYGNGPLIEEGRDQRFLRSFQVGLSFWL